MIKNEHTKAQMREMEKRFLAHQGPYLTLADVMAREKARQQAAEGVGKGKEDQPPIPGKFP